MKKICVYCGSGKGLADDYIEAAEKLGTAIVKNGYKLVYGGAKVGLMGKVSETVLNNNGEVSGIIPRALFEKEIANTSLKELIVVETMHERKAMMAEKSDAFIAMPGGFGTFEELFEILTWAQLGFHSKPVGILNINGYYDKLIEFIDNSISQQFIKEEHRQIFIVEKDPFLLIEKLKNYKAPAVNKVK